MELECGDLLNVLTIGSNFVTVENEGYRTHTHMYLTDDNRPDTCLSGTGKLGKWLLLVQSMIQKNGITPQVPLNHPQGCVQDNHGPVRKICNRANHHKIMNILAASFFLFDSGSGLQRLGRLIATIAYQICLLISGIKNQMLH